MAWEAITLSRSFIFQEVAYEQRNRSHETGILGVKRHTESGASGELISVILPIRPCRSGGDGRILAA